MRAKCKRSHHESAHVNVCIRGLHTSPCPISPNGTDVSVDRVYGLLNEDGPEQMGGLAVVFLSLHHKQQNNRTAGLWIDSVINPINHRTADGCHIWDNSSDCLPLFLICSRTHTSVHTHVQTQRSENGEHCRSSTQYSMTLHLGQECCFVLFGFHFVAFPHWEEWFLFKNPPHPY